MSNPLLSPRPEIAEGFKSGHFVLNEGWTHEGEIVGKTTLTIYEHDGGRLTAILSKRSKKGWKSTSLLASEVEQLRLLLNRARRERTRERLTVEPVVNQFDVASAESARANGMTYP